MSDTTASPAKKSARAARAEASVWIVRLHSDARTPEMEIGLREWLQAHPENARQFEHITEVWDIGGRVTPHGLPRMRSWISGTGFQPWAIAAAVLIVCGFGLFAAYRWWAPPAYATDRGEQRLVRLDDGSRVSLNSDTRLSVEFTSGARRVRLTRGEAFFEVSSNPARPFVVIAGDSQVTALGTAFVVRYEAARTAVTLVEGKVAVKPVATPREIILAPGERLTLASRAAPAVDSPRIDAVTAWRRGEVLLDSTPLTEAIAEMNRYDERQLALDGADLAAVRVSGVYRTGDSPGFARAVAELNGLQVVEREGRIYLRRP